MGDEKKLEFFFEVIFEIIAEGIFAGIYYLFNKFYKDKLSERTAKIISGILTAILVIGALAIVIVILDKLK